MLPLMQAPRKAAAAAPVAPHPQTMRPPPLPAAGSQRRQTPRRREARPALPAVAPAPGLPLAAACMRRGRRRRRARAPRRPAPLCRGAPPAAPARAPREAARTPAAARARTQTPPAPLLGPREPPATTLRPTRPPAGAPSVCRPRRRRGGHLGPHGRVPGMCWRPAASSAAARWGSVAPASLPRQRWQGPTTHRHKVRAEGKCAYHKAASFLESCKNNSLHSRMCFCEHDRIARTSKGAGQTQVGRMLGWFVSQGLATRAAAPGATPLPGTSARVTLP